MTPQLVRSLQSLTTDERLYTIHCFLMSLATFPTKTTPWNHIKIYFWLHFKHFIQCTWEEAGRSQWCSLLLACTQTSFLPLQSGCHLHHLEYRNQDLTQSKMSQWTHIHCSIYRLANKTFRYFCKSAFNPHSKLNNHHYAVSFNKISNPNQPKGCFSSSDPEF